MPPSAELLFFNGEGFTGDVVRFGTHSQFAHVAIRLTDESGDWVYEAIAPRVSKRRYDDTLPHSPDRFATHVALPAACDLAGKSAAFRLFLMSTVGEPYDWLAIAFDVLGWCLPSWIAFRDDSRRRWDCSRLATASLATLGYQPAALYDLRAPVSPGDLYRLLTTGDKSK